MPSADHTTYNIDDRMRRQLINEGWTPPPPSHSKQAADERIINEIARNDPTVHAFMKIKRERGMSWDDIMVSLVAHLAAEKRDLQTALRVTMQEQNVASVASAIMREQHTALRPAQNTQAPNWYDDH